MANENNVLFRRGNGNKSSATENDDVWDDRALIKAYDKAVNLAKTELSKRMGVEVKASQSKPKSQNSKHSNKCSKKWTVGAPCRAIYSEDGQVYEAIISKIYENTGTCIVKFVGYGNTEKVELSSLEESEGLQSQIAQQKDASAANENANNIESSPSNFASNPNAGRYNGCADEKMDYENEERKSFKKGFMPGSSLNSVLDMMPPAPPLPPQLMAKLPENDADALSSMLMSWYISGFHTGYYHGLKQARTNEEKRKKC